MKENRTNKTNRAIVTVATGEYNEYIPSLIESAHICFKAHVYLFTDQPDKYDVEKHQDLTVIETPHLGWPRMPLLRFELLHKYRDIYQEPYLFLLDAEAEFKKQVGNGVLGHRVATLHRNIMRFRDEFNYETRKDSTAYVAPDEGEKYYACGFVGGAKSEFIRMAGVIAKNIRTDIDNGIRARWGDESHLNRYLIDNRPTLVLPPSYMCPEGNVYYRKYIVHRDKDFKRVNIEDTDKYLKVNPNDYDLDL